ncbi:hypothetical protein DFJ73DRAFT_929448 [Zopfochytrium polystomum]|nr:hypothetical protein DFJ73DRAFT_929448 [Zopfochytrium polystomum]
MEQDDLVWTRSRQPSWASTAAVAAAASRSTPPPAAYAVLGYPASAASPSTPLFSRKRRREDLPEDDDGGGGGGIGEDVGGVSAGLENDDDVQMDLDLDDDPQQPAVGTASATMTVHDLGPEFVKAARSLAVARISRMLFVDLETAVCRGARGFPPFRSTIGAEQPLVSAGSTSSSGEAEAAAAAFLAALNMPGGAYPPWMAQTGAGGGVGEGGRSIAAAVAGEVRHGLPGTAAFDGATAIAGQSLSDMRAHERSHSMDRHLPHNHNHNQNHNHHHANFHSSAFTRTYGHVGPVPSSLPPPVLRSIAVGVPDGLVSRVKTVLSGTGDVSVFWRAVRGEQESVMAAAGEILEWLDGFGGIFRGDAGDVWAAVRAILALNNATGTRASGWGMASPTDAAVGLLRCLIIVGVEREVWATLQENAHTHSAHQYIVDFITVLVQPPTDVPPSTTPPPASSNSPAPTPTAPTTPQHLRERRPAPPAPRARGMLLSAFGRLLLPPAPPTATPARANSGLDVPAQFCGMLVLAGRRAWALPSGFARRVRERVAATGEWGSTSAAAASTPSNTSAATTAVIATAMAAAGTPRGGGGCCLLGYDSARSAGGLVGAAGGTCGRSGSIETCGPGRAKGASMVNDDPFLASPTRRLRRGNGGGGGVCELGASALPELSRGERLPEYAVGNGSRFVSLRVGGGSFGSSSINDFATGTAAWRESREGGGGSVGGRNGDRSQHEQHGARGRGYEDGDGDGDGDSHGRQSLSAGPVGPSVVVDRSAFRKRLRLE